MQREVLGELNAARRVRQAAVLVTDLANGNSRIVREGDQVGEGFSEAVGKAFRTGLSSSVEADGKTLFLTTCVPNPRLLVIGAVHISQALAPMAKLAGYETSIIDPRTAFATNERFPNVPLYAEWPETVLAANPLDPFTAVAALTHDPKIDDFALKAALDAGCFYVGALGSRKTHAARVSRFLAAGATNEQVARIHAPIGLDIGAASPAEIAVAILGQVIEALRRRGLQRKSEARAA